MAKEKAGVNLHGDWISRQALAAPDGYVSFVPERVYIPMRQHIGAPCEPTVQKGDIVGVGQLVGDNEANMAAPVHASVSGRVADIAEYPQPKGGKVLCVVIENDGKDTPFEEKRAPVNSLEDIRKAVRRAGIVGMGGATFPTHVKLDVKDKRVDVLIVNGAECEPGIFADNALMVGRAREIWQGAAYAMEAVGAKRILAGIEDDKPAAIAAMEEAAGFFQESIEVVALPHLYPQGGEKQLIHALTGRQVPEGALPADAGAVVVNVGTAHAIWNAVENGAPLTRRICTVTGDVARPQNIRFPIGTPAGALIEACGGFVGKPSKLISGGPMMGVAIDDFTVPLAKASNGLVAVGERHDFPPGEDPCIRCNRCVEVCPMFLVPWKLDRYWRRENTKGCRDFHAQSCINCGCCTYICPARRDLAEKITEAKNKLQQMDKEEKNG